MPRPIERVARSLLGITKNRVIEFLGFDSGTFNGGLGCNGAQFLRRIVFDFSAIAAKRRTYPADDSNISRFQHESRLYKLGWLARSQLVSLTEQLSALSSQLSALSSQLSALCLKFQMLKVLLLVKIRGPNASKCGMRKKNIPRISSRSQRSTLRTSALKF